MNLDEKKLVEIVATAFDDYRDSLVQQIERRLMEMFTRELHVMRDSLVRGEIVEAVRQQIRSSIQVSINVTPNDRGGPTS